MKKWLLMFLFALPACAVVVAPATVPHITFVDASGGPCASCTLQSFLAGTSTPTPTYTDSTGTSVNTNPIILDAAGGANIWLANLAYKLILKDATGTVIWTVDNVKGGGGLGGICGPSGAVQIANVGINGLTCDPNITINATNHTLNVGVLPASHVTIGALGTATSWNLDTTTPATALNSMGGVGDGGGTTTPNQLVISSSTLHQLTFSASIPDGITAITRSPSDNTTNPATTAYVALPGAINPTAVQIATGTSMTGNQGDGTLVQHSTGTVTSGHTAVFDANGNVIDGGTAPARTCNSNGCYRMEADGTIEEWGTASGCASSGSTPCTVTVTFPTPFTTTTNLSITSACSIDNCIASTSGKSTSTFGMQYIGSVVIGGGGGNMTGSQTADWHALGN